MKHCLVLPALLLLSGTAPGATPREEAAITVDADAPPDTRHVLTPSLRFGLDVSVESEYEGNFDLDRSRNADLLWVQPQANLALSFDDGGAVRGFVELELKRRWLLDAPDGLRRPSTQLDVAQLYVVARTPVPGMSLQVGRQRFEDEREWVYDEDLDAVRLFQVFGALALDASVSRRRLVDEDLLNAQRNERIDNYFLGARYAFDDDAEAGAYLLVRDDREARPEDLVHLGVRSFGELGRRVDYWFEAALARGKRRGRRIRGHGFDIGGTWQIARQWRPSLTVGYAFGSGDESGSDRVEHDFRQTGLQDNSARFNGVTSFKYYGEVLEPELSNLRITTVGFGIRPSRRSSVDLVYHHYRQDIAEDELRDAAIEAVPDGDDVDIGHGLDLVIGYREIQDLKLELVLGAFFPGRAFDPATDDAYFGSFEVKYSY
jgi:alginate production protein